MNSQIFNKPTKTKENFLTKRNLKEIITCTFLWIGVRLYGDCDWFVHVVVPIPLVLGSTFSEPGKDSSSLKDHYVFGQTKQDSLKCCWSCNKDI